MKIFISYTSQDKELAKYLAVSLSQAGHEVWYLDGHLLPGDNLAMATGKALENSDAMVVLVSPESMDSPWVRQEINYALVSPNYAGRLIPISVRDTEDVPWILRSFNIIRAGKNRAEVVRRILEQLEQARV